MRKIPVLMCLTVAVALLFSSCAPRISFDLDTDRSLKRHRVYIQNIEDRRPVNERKGYKIFYVESISDSDYEDGFLNEFRSGLLKGLDKAVTLATEKKESDITLNVTVHHFYGEYSQTVKTVLWEYGTVLLLFIPRIITDAIPYNSFSGRVAIDFDFEWKDQRKAHRSLDVTATDSVTSFKRGNADTTRRLSQAASMETIRILEDVLHEI